MTKMNRRTFTHLAASAAGLSALGFPMLASAKGADVVVIGGGFGGATASKYLKRFDPSINVTMVEPAKSFVTCPFSNTVIGGLNPIGRITQSYDGLRKRGIKVIHDKAAAIDAQGRKVMLRSGATLPYDRLIVSPGIDFRWGAVEGAEASIIGAMPHAWQAGPQTLLLRRQLEAMPDGGVFVISPPVNPFRCPPGPGERISLVANYFKRYKPKSKIIVLDPKKKFSKQGLFKEGWAKLYAGMIDYRNLVNDGKVIRVDAGAMILETNFGDKVKGDVVNFIPGQRVGKIAQSSGLADKTGWCPIDQLTFASRLLPNVHVIGDAAIASPMPKSGFAASSQAKVCAAAVAALLGGRKVSRPKFVNTCYSLVAQDYGISVAMVYDFADGKIIKVKGSGGLSPSGASDAFHRQEADFTRGWYDSITADIFG
ncbi:MAG: NAD(P)/FAD-dependent oxidoreductase [Alphaproteobacteria bacterium]|jgi:sulfide dehydrogenase [flavocytochrome c] flavoprotein subunit|nr:NAD(P)/FAD-dependent oxidoreductase [Alphaproteobacteria bacterium]